MFDDCQGLPWEGSGESGCYRNVEPITSYRGRLILDGDGRIGDKWRDSDVHI